MKKKSSLSLTRQLAIIVSVLMFVINTVLGVVLIVQSRQAMMDLIKGRMLDISNIAAAMIDGDAFENFDENSEGTAEYEKAYETLEKFQYNMECDYIYCVRADENSETGFSFVIDPSEDPAEYGESIVFTEALKKASEGTASVDEEATGDYWGFFYSAFSPIKNSEGKIVGVIGVDFKKEWLDNKISQDIRTIIIGVTIALILSIVLVVVAMSGVRRKFDHIHDELTALSGVVDELIAKMDMSDMSAPRIQKEEEAEPIADELVSIGVKVHKMRDTLDSFLEYMNDKAYNDSLTGVNNSAAYYKVVDTKNERIKNGTANFAVLIFDINGLKAINDEYGHAVGDLFILKCVEIMSNVLGKKNIYRVGGDEFIAVIDGATRDTLKEIYQRLDREGEIINSRKRPYTEEASFSRGATLFDPATDKEFKDVFKRADMLMYMNKTEYYALKQNQ